MTVEIVTVMSRTPDPVRESYYRPDVFFKSLERFGVTPTILGMNEPWGGLMTKPRRLREWLRAGNCKAETLIAVDAYDVVFLAPPDEVASRYWNLWRHGPIVLNAEKDLFPRGELRQRSDAIWEGRWGARDPGARSWPWKYLNSGFMVGEPAKVLALLESMWLDDILDDTQAKDDLHGGAGRWINSNDQGWFQYAYCAQIVPIDLDYGCNLCQCYSACTLDEFDLSGERIKNIVTGSEPMVAHLNGGSKNDLMPIFLKKWGLE